SGDEGDDSLSGGADNDVYLYNPGDGNDLIYDGGDNQSSSNDSIIASDIALADIYFQRISASPTDLIVKSFGHEGKITMQSHYNGSYVKIENLILSDATIQLYTSPLLFAADEEYTSILGSNYDDTLMGGSLNDTLSGGTGNDTYLFS